MSPRRNLGRDQPLYNVRVKSSNLSVLMERSDAGNAVSTNSVPFLKLKISLSIGIIVKKNLFNQIRDFEDMQSILFAIIFFVFFLLQH